MKDSPVKKISVDKSSKNKVNIFVSKTNLLFDTFGGNSVSGVQI